MISNHFSSDKEKEQLTACGQLLPRAQNTAVAIPSNSVHVHVKKKQNACAERYFTAKFACFVGWLVVYSCASLDDHYLSTNIQYGKKVSFPASFEERTRRLGAFVTVKKEGLTRNRWFVLSQLDFFFFLFFF